MSRTPFLLTLLLAAAASSSAFASDTFQQIAGQWRGAGDVAYADGTHERLQCRAAYDVLKDGSDLQLSIRCASAGYTFNLMGSAHDRAGQVSGTWSEASRNVAGSLSGTAQGNKVQVLAKSPAMTASLTMVTQGEKQTVDIRSQDSQSKLQGATLSLTR
jgi:hypothetical protein